MRFRSALVAALLVAAASVVAIHPAEARPVLNPHGVFRAKHPHAKLKRHNADTTSLNWSGYVVTSAPGKITEVTQHWTVAAAKLVPPGFSATWAGIGGYSDNSLIQAGTESDFDGTIQAWWELLPDPETPITSGCTGDTTCKVVAGDTMFVDIKNLGGDSWRFTMQNGLNGVKWTFTKDVVYHSLMNSAEWIIEAPTLLVAQTLIADVGTQQFTPGNTFTIDGVTKNIGEGSPVRILLSPGLLNFATPSALNPDGTAFNDCTYKQSCPAPS